MLRFVLDGGKVVAIEADDPEEARDFFLSLLGAGLAISIDLKSNEAPRVSTSAWTHTSVSMLLDRCNPRAQQLISVLADREGPVLVKELTGRLRLKHSRAVSGLTSSIAHHAATMGFDTPLLGGRDADAEPWIGLKPEFAHAYISAGMKGASGDKRLIK